jgi:hypothetical protein
MKGDKANVVTNELAARQLGYQQPSEAVGQSFWGIPGELCVLAYKVIGVVQEQKFS